MSRRLALATSLLIGCASSPKSESIATDATARCDDPTAFDAKDGALPAARRFIEACGVTNTSSLTGTLVAFPTVRAKEDKTGPSFSAMRRYLERWSAQRGFEFESFDDDPWVISWGEGDPSVAFVMHADVVPVDPKAWKTSPFEIEKKGDRLYGRGTEDDKGPIAAVLHAMDTLKKLGHRPQGRVMAILGTGEEHNWDGMVAYAKSQPHAKFVVSIDANFPVVVAESGFVAWRLEAPLAKGKKPNPGCFEASTVEGGQFLTQVPGEARITYAPPANAAWEEAAKKVITREHVRHEVAIADDEATLTMFGKAVHSSVAHDGVNAMGALAAVANDVELCPGGIRDMLRVVARFLDGDLWGERLGLAYEHDMMGRLLVTPTVLKVEGDKVLLSINMRRPEGKTVDEFNTSLDTALAKIQSEISSTIVEQPKGRYVGKPALAETDGPLVDTLLELYREAANVKDAKPLSIRGGTYARLFPGAVSFGPSIPGREYRGHAPDEYLEIDALQLMNKTIVEAIVRLDALATERRSALR